MAMPHTVLHKSFGCQKFSMCRVRPCTPNKCLRTNTVNTSTHNSIATPPKKARTMTNEESSTGGWLIAAVHQAENAPTACVVYCMWSKAWKSHISHTYASFDGGDMRCSEQHPITSRFGKSPLSQVHSRVVWPPLTPSSSIEFEEDDSLADRSEAKEEALFFTSCERGKQCLPSVKVMKFTPDCSVKVQRIVERLTLEYAKNFAQHCTMSHRYTCNLMTLVQLLCVFSSNITFVIIWIIQGKLMESTILRPPLWNKGVAQDCERHQHRSEASESCTKKPFLCGVFRQVKEMPPCIFFRIRKIFGHSNPDANCPVNVRIVCNKTENT